jgi:pimeloyl-ACP methyl ester carboxylesterase
MAVCPDPNAVTAQFWTASGVRLRAHSRRPGHLNWLFLPGGPGIGSESLNGLANVAALPGTSWLVDLPGDGSNTRPPVASGDLYQQWPQVLLEAALAVSDPVFVGHSTGGMYLLSTPGLEDIVRGLVLISTAPNAQWLSDFVAMTERHPLESVALATAAYRAHPTDAHLGRIAIASAAWNFAPQTVDAGAALLGRMPYNRAAVDWSAAHFDSTYTAAWWPLCMPTLVISGSEDRIVTQHLWNDASFHGHHVLHRTIAGGAHFPWLENPGSVHASFAEFSALITDHRPSRGATADSHHGVSRSFL